jgi:phosphoserine phosphatase
MSGINRDKSSLPLVVDLDDTLVRADLLHEAILRGLREAPLKTLRAGFEMFFAGSSTTSDGAALAAFKTDMVDFGPSDYANLPYRDELVEFLKSEKEYGRPIFLVSASPDTWVQGVASQLGLFDAAYGSTPSLNLKGSSKAEFLQGMFPDGYAYAGDSSADIPVWESARETILVDVSPAVATRASKLSTPIVKTFASKSEPLNVLAKAARVHQWVKNLLVFVPVILSKSENLELWVASLLAFISLSLVASATYFINDLLDLDAGPGACNQVKTSFCCRATQCARWRAACVIRLECRPADCWSNQSRFADRRCCVHRANACILVFSQADRLG